MCVEKSDYSRERDLEPIPFQGGREGSELYGNSLGGRIRKVKAGNGKLKIFKDFSRWKVYIRKQGAQDQRRRRGRKLEKKGERKLETRMKSGRKPRSLGGDPEV